MFTGGVAELKEVIKLNIFYYYPGDVWYVLVLVVPLVIFVVHSLISCSFNNNKKNKNLISEKEIDADYQSPDFVDVFFHQQHNSHNYDYNCNYDYENENEDENENENENGDVLLEEADHDDAKYAEELQVQEALFGSILYNNPSPTTSSSSSPLTSFLFNNNHDYVYVEEIQVCNICLENHEKWIMFTNSTCRHSFCYECITKYATTMVQQKNNNITCPEFNCNSTLDSTILRLMVPRHIMIKWDELLCESTILETHKLYCPFANCSALLINDDITITETNCPVCQRSICVVCRVPWHSDFTCKEFCKLNRTKNGKKDDKMTQALAKKKKWKKCPKCKFFVEKSEGCLHITCRCNYEFCYRCGAKWTKNHGMCRTRSGFFRLAGLYQDVDFSV